MELNYSDFCSKFSSCKQMHMNFRLHDTVYSIEKRPDSSCICFTHLSEVAYPNVLQMIDQLTFDGKRIKDIWEEVTILDLFDFTYPCVKERFISGYADFSFVYQQKIYWVTEAHGIYFIGTEDGSWLEQFTSPVELFERARVVGKSLKEIWESIIIEHFQ